MADTHLQYARLLALSGDRSASIESYRNALDLDPSSPVAAAELREALRSFLPEESQEKLRSLVSYADDLRDRGYFLEAARHYALALELLPHDAHIAVQRANMLKDAGRFAEAREAFVAAAELDPARPDAYVGLGHLANLQGNKALARIAFETALSLDAERDDARHELMMMGIMLHQEEAWVRRHALGVAAKIAETAARVGILEAEAAALRASVRSLDAEASFPLSYFNFYLDAHEIPPPPASSFRTVRILLAGEHVGIGNIHRLLNALLEQDHPLWTLTLFGGTDDVRSAVARIAVAESRLAMCDSSELRVAVAGLQPEDCVMLPAPNAIPHPHAISWLLYALEATGAWGAISDGVVESDAAGSSDKVMPVLRDAPDPIAIWQGRSGDMGSLLTWAETLQESLPGWSTAEEARIAASAHLINDARLSHVAYPLFRGPNGILEVTLVAAAPADSSFKADQIAVIILTRDNGQDAAEMVRSLRAQATHPHLLNITVIDNGSQDPTTLALLSELAEEGRAVVRRVDQPFNWSWLNNDAVRLISAPLLVFANDDMRMISAGWDGELRRFFSNDRVGVVGAHLQYEDGTIQHAGVLMGWHGSVIHDGIGCDADAPGFGGRYLHARSASAVTGAFLAIRRNLFDTLGGFDDKLLPIAYSDIDLCLKVRARDYAVVVTPTIQLYHFESKSRGADHQGLERRSRNEQESAVMKRRWGAELMKDRGLNPHWSQVTLPFRLVRWPSGNYVLERIHRTGRGQSWHWCATTSHDQTTRPSSSAVFRQ